MGPKHYLWEILNSSPVGQVLNWTGAGVRLDRCQIRVVISIKRWSPNAGLFLYFIVMNQVFVFKTFCRNICHFEPISLNRFICHHVKHIFSTVIILKLESSGVCMYHVYIALVLQVFLYSQSAVNFYFSASVAFDEHFNLQSSK